MAKTLSVVWLGDADPSQQVITQNGLTFVKGEATSVPADHADAQKLKENPMFAVNEDADPVDAEEEAEIAALKEALDAKGIRYRSNANIASLRKALADSEVE